MNNDKIEESAGFVARHFIPGAFSRKNTWRHLGIGNTSHLFPLRHRLKYAAVWIFAIALTASAVVLLRNYTDAPGTTPIPSPSEKAVQTIPVNATLRFNDTPLTDVVSQIQQTYGVKVKNIPPEDYHLTGVYEGTADDIIATINDLLGINLEIEK